MDLKRKMLNRIDIAENEQVRALCGALASMERNRRETQADHFDALGVDADAPDLPPHEERVEQLVALLEARLSDDPWGYWAEYLAPDDLEHVDRAKDYAGMDDDEWDRRVSKWADIFRGELDGGEALTDRELASLYTERRFGVDLDRFETAVVEWDPSRILEAGVAGPTQAMDEALVSATEEVSEG